MCEFTCATWETTTGADHPCNGGATITSEQTRQNRQYLSARREATMDSDPQTVSCDVPQTVTPIAYHTVGVLLDAANNLNQRRKQPTKQPLFNAYLQTNQRQQNKQPQRTTQKAQCTKTTTEDVQHTSCEKRKILKQTTTKQTTHKQTTTKQTAATNHNTQTNNKPQHAHTHTHTHTHTGESETRRRSNNHERTDKTE